jgi:hypothetical protein
MWQEFSRETPARPGMAIVASALALAISTASAVTLVHKRERPINLPVDELLDGWPIAFSLPKDCDPFSSIHEDDLPLSQLNFDGMPLYTAKSGSYGAMAYHYLESPSEQALILISFRVLDDASSLQQAFSMLTGVDPASAEATKVGPFDGLSYLSSSILTDGRMMAVGWDPSGLAVLVECRCPNSGAANRRIFRSVCASVKPVEWWVER